MGPLLSLFGGENVVLTVLISLAIVLVLIILGVWALKLVFNVTGRASRGRAKRLGVIDISPVDQKRRLVLVRRDNVEHLLLIGGGQDVVVESGITTEPLSVRLSRLTPTGAHQPAAAQPAAQQPTAPAPAPAAPQSKAPASAPAGTRAASPSVGPTRLRSTNLPPDLVATPNAMTQSRTSLRHTALMRPNERREPDFIPNPPQRPSSEFADSDNKTGVEPVPTQAGTGSSEPDNRSEPHLGRDGDEAHANEAHKNT